MANFQMRLDQRLLGEAIYNITYWELPADDSVTLQEFADGIRASYVTHVEPYLSNDWSIEGITVRQMDGAGAFSFPQPFTSGTLVGGSASNNLPLFNALLVSTGYIGPRPNRGRVYFGGVTEGSNDTDATWLGPDLQAFVDLVTAWKDGISTTAGSAFLRIVRPDFTLNSWTLSSPIDTVIGRTNAATMRSRMP